MHSVHWLAVIVCITFEAVELVHSAGKGAATPYLRAIIVALALALALTSLCPLAVSGGSDPSPFEDLTTQTVCLSAFLQSSDPYQKCVLLSSMQLLSGLVGFSNRTH